MDWFRSHHGAPSDPKWLVIARKAKTQPVVVVSVFWTLLDYASQQANRGDVSGFDPESVAAFLGVEEEEVFAVMHALEEKGIIAEGRIANWSKRQPKREREDNSTGRVQRHRESTKAKTDSVTPCNATQRQETPRGDKKRGEESIYAAKAAATREETTASEGAGIAPVGYFDSSKPLPVSVENFLTHSPNPALWRKKLLLELEGRELHSAERYALSLLRKWKEQGLPQAPPPRGEKPRPMTTEEARAAVRADLAHVLTHGDGF